MTYIMGQRRSKSSPLVGDAKYMERKHPQSARFVDKWQTKHGFERKLVPGKCRKIVNVVKGEMVTKTETARGEKQKELECAIL